MSKLKASAAELWRKHDIYKDGVSCRRVVTKSQIPFMGIKNTSSDLELFANNQKHHPEGKNHLMVTLKGKYGAFPRTVITRSLAEYLRISEELCEEVNEYKKASSHSETKHANEHKEASRQIVPQNIKSSSSESTSRNKKSSSESASLNKKSSSEGSSSESASRNKKSSSSESASRNIKSSSSEGAPQDKKSSSSESSSVDEEEESEEETE